MKKERRHYLFALAITIIASMLLYEVLRFIIIQERVRVFFLLAAFCFIMLVTDKLLKKFGK